MHKLKRLTASLLLALCFPVAQAAELSYHYGDKDYSGKDLPASIRIQLYELETRMNQQRQDIVDQYILDAWLRDKAKAEGKTPEEYAAKALEVAEPSEKDLKKYYDENWEKIQKPYKEVKEELLGAVWAEKQQEKLKEVLKQITAENNYKVNLPQAEAPVFEINTTGYPSKGNASASVTIVEFADFQCPHCKEASEIVDKVVSKYSDKARLVYRHMPINPSGISRKVAVASVCADQQGKFWEYHDLAFKQQDSLTDKSPLKLATELKLDEAKMKTCLDDPKTLEAVNASETEGRNLGVNSTPSFFVNGKPFRPQVDMEKELIATLESALGNTASTSPATTTNPAPDATNATSSSNATSATSTETPPTKGAGIGTCSSSTATTGSDANCKPE
ncbi:thioredoxin domain-containing protein [uncultured Thiothrix sp.]|mgnify:CR=1 FL=1|uniref:thioredoxin domain-containing protein n=1 Tax=uncultured Thiothrix sp. TaxID=223185 RepID=UPI00261C77F4|nr:thioredoxin domain-containing protein [uncultured Thiothrix sp.]